MNSWNSNSRWNEKTPFDRVFFELKIINDLKYTLKSDMALLFYAYNITEELKEKNQMR